MILEIIDKGTERPEKVLRRARCCMWIISDYIM